jgi:carbonic anhydrase
MKNLVDGLQQFVHTVQASERDLFLRLATQQTPSVLFVTCSDSRVVPHLMTQADPGELFVIRNAGNIIPPPRREATGEAATLEYAVNALGVADIIVCGHSNCGAMKGLLQRDDLNDTLPTVKEWLSICEPTRSIMDTHYADLPSEARLNQTIELNVLAQLNNLRCHSSVAARLHKGDISLHGWVYDIPSGVVRGFDSTLQAFVNINEPASSGTSQPNVSQPSA